MFKNKLCALIGIYLLISFVLILLVLAFTNSHFIYVIDDPYIHMAIAKNFVNYGVWGVTKYEFSSTSSSPLWTLTISLFYKIFGVNDLSPLFINLPIGIILISYLYKIFDKNGNSMPKRQIFYFMMFVVFAVPIIPMVFSGLEHTTHILLSLILANSAAKIVTEEHGKGSIYESIILFSIIPFITLIRFESLFLIFIICILFLFRRKIILAFCMGILGIIPIFIYGLISVNNGENWLPNSLLVKGSFPGDLKPLPIFIPFFLISACKKLIGTPSVLFLLITAICLFCI